MQTRHRCSTLTSLMTDVRIGILGKHYKVYVGRVGSL